MCVQTSLDMKGVYYGEHCEEEKSESHKRKKNACLYLLNLWEGRENPLSPLFTQQS
jgi:hypothetical protein